MQPKHIEVDNALSLSYAQTKNETPFDWNAFLKQDIITESEWSTARVLASDWVTCACGNECSVIPRDKNNGRPIDERLAAMGIKFYTAVKACNAELCLFQLADIEKRVAFLLTQPDYQVPPESW